MMSKKISRPLWRKTVLKWYEYSKEYLIGESYRVKVYSCGYCADARSRMLEKDRHLCACPYCIIPPQICNNDQETDSYYRTYYNASDQQEKAKSSLIIFRAIIQLGETLGYIKGVQRKQVKELEKLEAKLLKEA
jgi:hypothetical protein